MAGGFCYNCESRLIDGRCVICDAKSFLKENRREIATRTPPVPEGYRLKPQENRRRIQIKRLGFIRVQREDPPKPGPRPS